jgi:hypothetical protein
MTRAKWRLYADEDIEKATIDELRKADFNVLWVNEHKNLKGKEDKFHFLKSRQLGLYFLTRDMDFWDNFKYPLRNCPNIIIVQNKDPRITADMLKSFRTIGYSYFSPQGSIRDTQIKFRISEKGITFRYIDVDNGEEREESMNWEDF